MSHQRATRPYARIPFKLSVLTMSISAILTGCGGGGGGSARNPGSSAPAYTGDLTNASSAHARGITGAGVTVGIVDTDFNVASPELAGRISKDVYTAGAGFIGASGNGDSHGTQVAEALGGTCLLYTSPSPRD